MDGWSRKPPNATVAVPVMHVACHSMLASHAACSRLRSATFQDIGSDGKPRKKQFMHKLTPSIMIFTFGNGGAFTDMQHQTRSDPGSKQVDSFLIG